jgi:hypothetical protein
MAATVILNRLTGAGPTLTPITGGNTRASTSDNPYTTETTNPIPIPTGADKFSFWVVTRPEVTVAPTGTLNNLKWYTDGASGFGTGVTCKAADASVYDQATGTQGDTGTELTVANYGNGTTDLNAAPLEVFANFTSGSPLSVAGSTTTTSSTFADMVVYQIIVANTASAGTLTAETFTWQYDET